MLGTTPLAAVLRQRVRKDGAFPYQTVQLDLRGAELFLQTLFAVHPNTIEAYTRSLKPKILEVGDEIEFKHQITINIGLETSGLIILLDIGKDKMFTYADN